MRKIETEEEKNVRIRSRIDKINASIKELLDRIDKCNDEIGRVQKKCDHKQYIRYPCPAGGSSDYQCCTCDKWL